MEFSVPSRGNRKLKALVKHIGEDSELLQLWRCANINAVDRGNISDHGDVHIRIVANAALRILRLLMDAGVEPSVVGQHGLTAEDAEVVVVLAACVHDLGIAIHREDHERYSLILAYPKARQLLSPIYEEPDLTTMVSEVLHAAIAHRADVPCLTHEAGVLKIADALDMTQGRSRIPFESGQVNIHSVSAQAVEAVKVKKGDKRPVRIEIILANSAGIFQVDELLKRKLQHSSVAPHVEVVARTKGKSERRLFEIYRM
jgi:hypothetical protein